MSLERAAMRGRLAELQEKERRLKFRIDGDAAQIRAGLNLTLTRHEDLPVPVLDEQWDQLKGAWAELIKVQADISRIERELA